MSDESVLTASEVDQLLLTARANGLLDQAFEPARATWPIQPEEHVLAGAPVRVSLRGWQTPNKRQLLRGTCYSFATIAAMEAAINRKYGVVVDLSEQYLFHVYKSSDAQGARTVSGGKFDTGTSLEGFQGNSNAVEAAFRIAIPFEQAAPYRDQPELDACRQANPAANPPPANPGAGLFASQRQLDEFEWSDVVVPLIARQQTAYRIAGFHTVGASAAAVQKEIIAGREVVMDVPSHCVLVIGFDTSNNAWEIKNSWNDNAPIWVPSGNQLTTFLGGYAVDDVELLPAPQPHSAWLGRWHGRLGASTAEFFVHRFTDRNVGLGGTVDLQGEATATRLGDIYVDGVRRDVNGWLEDSGRTMVMYVAPNAEQTSVGARSGERHEVRLVDGDWMRATGSSPGVGAVSMWRDGAVELGYGRLGSADDGLRNVNDQPAITTWGRDRLDLFVGSHSGFGHSYYGADGWSDWEELGGAHLGVGRSQVSAASWRAQRLDQFLIGDDGRLQHGWHDAPDGWGFWDDLGGSLDPTSSVGVVARRPGRLDVFAKSSFGLVVHLSFDADTGWSGWSPIEAVPARSLAFGLSATFDESGIWLVSVDSVTGRPIVRRLDDHTGWSPWSDIATSATLSVPAVVVNEAPLQLAGRPISYRLHVLWLPQLANGPASFVHSVGLPDAFTSHPVELSSLEPVGIAAAAWGNGRIDAIVTDRHADGDLTHIAAVEHVWSDDHGETFGSETLSIG